MGEAERAAVVAALPCCMTESELSPPEGDPHGRPLQAARDALEGWFRSQHRGVYVGVDLMVYYPDEQRFAPDAFVVLDVDPGERDTWVVSAEGRGLDWVLEVLYSGDRHKDLVFNVARYARLGVPEYFVYDRRRQRLHGWRLPHPGARVYEPVIPQAGRYAADALGLQISIEGTRLRFHAGSATVLQSPEVFKQLSVAMDQLGSRLDAAEAAAEAARHEAEAAAEAARHEAEAAAEAARHEAEAAAEAARLEAEAVQAAQAARIAELQAQIERLTQST
jgi:Uma2 family endonuclease